MKQELSIQLNRAIELHAKKHDQSSVIKELLGKGADASFTIQTKDGDTYSVLMVAIHHCHHDIVEILLRAGANKEFKSTPNPELKDAQGRTALEMAQQMLSGYEAALTENKALENNNETRRHHLQEIKNKRNSLATIVEFLKLDHLPEPKHVSCCVM